MASAHIRAVLIGAVAGMRCFSALAFTSQRIVDSTSLEIKDSRLSFLSSDNFAKGIAIAAVGELIGDKTSFIPNRIEPGPITGRAISGAICGAAIFTEEKKDPLLGASIGLLAAIASAYIFFHLRRELTTKYDIPDISVALCEDALMVGASLLSERKG